MTYRFLPHTADIRVEMAAPTLADLLDDTVRVVHGLVAGASEAAPRTASPITVAARDVGDLVFEFTRELLRRFQEDGLVPARWELGELSLTRAGPAALVGTLLGEPFDLRRHDPQPEVKAITRHGFVVEQDTDGWRAEMIFDV